MDCEKFDRIVLDLLYDELDELTQAAAKRHMEHCNRCRAIGAGLRATREVGVLPLVDAPVGLELRIVAGEQRAAQLLPLGKRLGRGLSLLAGYAMRPQLAMAALLMLLIGSSLLFLRAQPGDREHVLVTERGVPESDTDSVAVVAKPATVTDPGRAQARAAPPPARAEDVLPHREHPADLKAEARASSPRELPAPAPAAATRPDDHLGAAEDAPGTSQILNDSDASYDAAMASYRDGRYSEALRRFEEIASQGGSHAPSAALYEVQALRMVSGCPKAAPRFEDVHSRYPGPIGNDAAWQAADCYRSLGELGRAREDYQQLAADPSYRTRAKEAIAELDQRVADQESAARKALTPNGAAAPAKPKTDASSAPAGDAKRSP